MANLNKVFLMGRLTRDPELRYTPGGAAVTDLSVAINRTYNTRDGESREETVFVDVTVWDRQAETCCQYLKKGRGVHVEGALKMDTWDDKTTGEKRSKLKVQADRVQFLDRREDGASGGGGSGYEELPPPARERDRSDAAAAPRRPANGPAARGYGAPAGGGTPSPAPAPRRPMNDPEPPAGDEDDDIPF